MATAEVTVRFAAVGVAYLVGAVPFGVLVGRWRGVDVRTHGSGNIGATNVGRVLGWRAGALVFALDFLKGLLPTLGALGLAPAATGGPDVLVVGTGFAAVAGHVWPVYLGMRGGKGVATASGVLAALAPIAFGAALLSWLAVLALGRMVSLSSLVAALALTATQAALWLREPSGGEGLVAALCAAVTVLVFVRHRGNIRRIVAGTESRVGGGKPP
ncbi:MAG: glycerol-3-phosphate 1-O-acyltransferase PlsY [Planctomycetes bacterium]|nr:glycerol-3-phosphate 1-O-acyltransferase PlsY [Planctomycetota bacterium]